MARFIVMAAAAALCMATAAPAAAQMHGDQLVHNYRQRGTAVGFQADAYVTGMVRAIRMTEELRGTSLVCIPRTTEDGVVREAVMAHIPTLPGWRGERVDNLVMVSLLHTYPCRRS